MSVPLRNVVGPLTARARQVSITRLMTSQRVHRSALMLQSCLQRRRSWPVLGMLLECAGCGCQTSVIAGTIFQDTRTPLPVWFRAMWWVTQKNGASALGLQRVLGLESYETAWAWLHKLRRAMVRPGRDRLRFRAPHPEGVTIWMVSTLPASAPLKTRQI